MHRGAYDLTLVQLLKVKGNLFKLKIVTEF